MKTVELINTQPGSWISYIFESASDEKKPPPCMGNIDWNSTTTVVLQSNSVSVRSKIRLSTDADFGDWVYADLQQRADGTFFYNL